MRSYARWGIAIVLATASACSRDGSSAGDAPPGAPAAPTSLVATQWPLKFDAVSLSWSGDCAGGYELDGRFLGLAWERLHDGLVPADVRRPTVSLDPALPERLDLAFRIRCVDADGLRSDWAEAPYRRGIRPGEAISARLEVPPARERPTIVVEHASRSAVATAARLERLERTAAGALVASELVAAGAVGDPLADLDLHAASTYRYRVSYGVDGEWSEGSLGTAELLVPLVPPADVTIAVTAAGPRLAWTYPGALPTGFDVVEEIDWFPWETRITSLPPDARAYVLPAAPPWPSARYRVQAYVAPSGTRGSDDLLARAPAVSVGSFELAGDVGTFGVSAVDVAPGRFVARDASGAFHALGDDSLRAWTLWRPLDGGGWDGHVLGSYVTVMPPGLRVDGAGHPHAMFRGAGPWQHVWHDGADWRSEEVPAPNDDTAIAFDVAADGTAYVAYQGWEPAAPPWPATVLATRGADGWSTERLPMDGYVLGSFGMAVAGDGTVYLAGVGYQSGDATMSMSATLVERPAGGAWTLRRVTDVASFAGARAVLLPAATGHAALAIDAGDPGNAIVFVQRSGDGFATPEDTGIFAWPGSAMPAAAMRGDGSGARLATGWNAGVDLHGRVDAGWASTLLAARAATAVWIGYGAEDRLWVAARPYSEAPEAAQPEVLFEAR